MLVITGSSNAVNLTDGMDGLASGCMGIVSFVFASGKPHAHDVAQILDRYGVMPGDVDRGRLLGGVLYKYNYAKTLGHPARDSLGRFTVTNADLVRRRDVTNRHYGWLPRLRVQHAGGALTVGGANGSYSNWVISIRKHQAG